MSQPSNTEHGYDYELEIHLGKVANSRDFLERKFVLSASKPCMPIGRKSRRTAKGSAVSTQNAVFSSPAVSRTHAELRVHGSPPQLTITDLGSMHGTKVNDVPMIPHQAYTLKQGDRVRLGIQLYLFPDKTESPEDFYVFFSTTPAKMLQKPSAPWPKMVSDSGPTASLPSAQVWPHPQPAAELSYHTFTVPSTCSSDAESDDSDASEEPYTNTSDDEDEAEGVDEDAEEALAEAEEQALVEAEENALAEAEEEALAEAETKTLVEAVEKALAETKERALAEAEEEALAEVEAEALAEAEDEALAEAEAEAEAASEASDADHDGEDLAGADHLHGSISSPEMDDVSSFEMETSDGYDSYDEDPDTSLQGPEDEEPELPVEPADSQSFNDDVDEPHYEGFGPDDWAPPAGYVGAGTSSASYHNHYAAPPMVAPVQGQQGFGAFPNHSQPGVFTSAASYGAGWTAEMLRLRQLAWEQSILGRPANASMQLPAFANSSWKHARLQGQVSLPSKITPSKSTPRERLSISNLVNECSEGASNKKRKAAELPDDLATAAVGESSTSTARVCIDLTKVPASNDVGDQVGAPPAIDETLKKKQVVGAATAAAQTPGALEGSHQKAVRNMETVEADEMPEGGGANVRSEDGQPAPKRARLETSANTLSPSSLQNVMMGLGKTAGIAVVASCATIFTLAAFGADA